MLQELEHHDRPWEECAVLLKDKIGDRLPTRDYLEQFRIRREWFAHPDLVTDIHGIAHMGRVLVLVNLVARIYPGMPLLEYELDAVSASAVTHDTQRLVHHTSDPGHGDRAGLWLINKFLYADKDNTEHLASLNRLSLMYASYINIHHEPDDREDTMSDLLAIFKDADALDRFRDPHVGEWNFNPTYLRFAQSRLLIPIAKELVRRSHWYIAMGQNHFDAVLDSAGEMKLLAE